MTNWRENSELKAVLADMGKRHEVIKELGGGGFSKVYLVKHEVLGYRALKIMDTEFLRQKWEKQGGINVKEEFYKIEIRFTNEAKFYQKLQSPYIVKIFDINAVPDEKNKINIPYILMEYIQGPTLQKVIKQKVTFKWDRISAISKSILTALNLIHRQNVIHRDIKPENIIIRAENDSPVLIDFGLAKDLLSETNLTTTGALQGTPLYMSPEQFIDTKKITEATDIYSFGVVLFEMLTGRTPFKGDRAAVMHGHCLKSVPNVRNMKSDLPIGIEKVVDKALAKGPENRYQGADEFLNALLEIDKKNKIVIEQENLRVQKEIEQKIKAEQENITTEVLPDNKREIEKKDMEEPKQVKTLISVMEFIIYLALIASLIFASFVTKSLINDLVYQKYVISARFEIQNNYLNKAVESLNKAKALNDSGEVHELFEAIINKKREDMSKDIEFINRHRDIPPNRDTRLMVSEAKALLQSEIKKASEYKQTIAEMRKDSKTLERNLQGNMPLTEKIQLCRDFLTKYENEHRKKESNPMITAANTYIKQYDAEIKAEKKYQQYIASGNKYLAGKEYKKAETAFNRAGSIKDTPGVRNGLSTAQGKLKEIRDNERINGDTLYNKIKNNMNRRKYLDFEKKYPKSIQLSDLKSRVLTKDKNLPPGKYWAQAIERNSKGYYEYTFANWHVMIYIPKKKFWIDKYEVSNREFRGFLLDTGRSNQTVESDEYRSGEDNFPVTVTYGDAVEYCKKYGFSLPTEQEWEFAAGKGEFTYSWGNAEPDEGGIFRANFSGEADGYPGTAPVDSFMDFPSPFGVVNMIGNVWEWVQGNLSKGGSFYSVKEELAIESRSKPGFIKIKGFRCIMKE